MVVMRQHTAMPATLTVMILRTVCARRITMTTMGMMKMEENVNQVRYCHYFPYLTTLV